MCLRCQMCMCPSINNVTVTLAQAQNASLSSISLFYMTRPILVLSVICAKLGIRYGTQLLPIYLEPGNEFWNQVRVPGSLQITSLYTITMAS